MELERTTGIEHGVVAPVRVRPATDGGPTRRDVAGDGWRRSSRGLYVPQHVERTAHQRVVEAGALVPAYAAVTGWAALSWHGGRWFGGAESDGSERPVPLACGRHRLRPPPGVQLCEERFGGGESSVVDGVVVTSPLRSLWFEMRYCHGPRAAVVALDMAAYDDLVEVEEARAYALRHPSYTGIEQCRAATLLGDENSWSPMETRMRLAWILDAGRPSPLSNRPIFDSEGGHLVTPDLLDPVAGVVAEYDGEVHLSLPRRRRDLQREELYRDHGLEAVVVVSGGVRDFPARLDAAYERAARRTGPRSWTLETPDWWARTHSVALRRQLDRAQRDLWLRYRAA